MWPRVVTNHTIGGQLPWLVSASRETRIHAVSLVLAHFRSDERIQVREEEAGHDAPAHKGREVHSQAVRPLLGSLQEVWLNPKLQEFRVTPFFLHVATCGYSHLSYREPPLTAIGW